MTHAHVLRRPDRRGFSLIELIIVIAIIATLAAISVGAYARVRASAMQGATNATLQKLASALDVQMKAATDTSREASVGQDRVARAVALKQAIHDEFPQSFAEARGAKPIWANQLPPTSGLSPFEESAVCLYLALNLGRRGTAPLSDDAVGANNVKTVGGGWKVYADNWGTPIGFVRWPYMNAELNDPQYGTAVDPQDPEGVATTDFVNRGLTPNGPVTRNVVPAIVSAGPDKNPGFDFPWMANQTAASWDNLVSYRVRRAGAKGN